MKINNQNTEVQFSFTPANFILVRSKNGVWSLNYLIDRSEKGKSPDVGTEKIYLSDQEAEQCKKLGFSYCNEN